jgi:hypothetical protein
VSGAVFVPGYAKQKMEEMPNLNNDRAKTDGCGNEGREPLKRLEAKTFV